MSLFFLPSICQEALETFAFLVFMVFCLVGSVYLYSILPETKNKTFMDISQSFATLNKIPVPPPVQEMESVLSIKPGKEAGEEGKGADVIEMESSF